MNKCVNECIRSWCISFLSPQLPEAARLVSSPARRQVPGLGAGAHLLGRTPREAASPLPPWPQTGLPWHRLLLFTHLGFSSAWTRVHAELRGLGPLCAHPAPGQPQPMEMAGWGLRASHAPEPQRGAGSPSPQRRRLLVSCATGEIANCCSVPLLEPRSGEA